MSSREVIHRLREDGWYEVAHEGSHKQFKHGTKTGRVRCRIRRVIFPSGRLEALKNKQVSG